MSFKLYVGNLSYNVTGDQLKDLFAQAGTVADAIIITDRQAGNRSKGFGFVEMSSKEELDKAIEMFDQTEYEGRMMRVSEARPPREKSDFNQPRRDY